MNLCEKYLNSLKLKLCSNKYSPVDKKIIYISNYEYDYFLCKANVLGIGLGYKEINGIATSRKCLKVFVKNKCPSNDIPPKDLIPKSYKGIDTDVTEIGIIKSSLLEKSDFFNLRERIRPVPGGYGISAVNINSLGSMGCLAKNDDDELCLIGSYTNLAMGESLGVPIVQPASIDGGMEPKDAIAELYNYIPLELYDPHPINLVACALCTVTNPQIVSSSIAFIGPPKGTTDSVLGESVKKVGCATGLTTGTVTSTDTTVRVELPGGISTIFQDQITTTPMSQPGDTGAVLLNRKNEVIGLVFAESNNVTVCNDMNLIESFLGFTIVTG